MPQKPLPTEDYLQFQFATVESFGGGMVDNYLNAPVDAYERGDNLYITDETVPKLRSREGSAIYAADAYRVVASRVGDLFDYDEGDSLLAQASKKVYYNNAGTWTEIVGPSSGSCFSAGDAGSVVSSSEWRGILYLVNDDFASPSRIYKDSGGTLRLRNAGLPALASDPTVTTEITPFVTLAKEIATDGRSHALSTTMHTAGAHTAFGNALRFYSNLGVSYWTYAHLEAFTEFTTNYPMYFQELHTADASQPSGWSYHEGQDTSVQTVSNSNSNLGEIATCLNTWKASHNDHDANDPSHGGTVSQYQVSAANISLPSAYNSLGASDTAAYIYGFAYVYSYTVGSVTFEDAGPITLVRVLGLSSVGLVENGGQNIREHDITGIPELTGGNYDTTNIDVRIYRSEANGSTLYKLADIDNGTTTYTDNLTDTELVTNAVAYTDGGVLDNNPPPKCKRVHVANNVALWGNSYDGTSYFPSRVHQAVPDDPDSVPSSLYDDMQDTVISISSANGKHIILGERRIYRRDGYYDELGQGIVDHDEISGTAGCKAPNSPVQIPEGLVWWGRDGVYFTDGYRVFMISKGIRDTYAGLISTATKQERVRGAYWAERNVVWWSCQESDSASDNDSVLVLHLNQGIKPYSAFTLYNNGTSFSPTALVTFGGQMIRAGGLTNANMPGYLFKHDEDYTTDPLITNGVTDPAQWTTKTIVWDYKSPASPFGDAARRKFASRMWVTARNNGNTSLQINSTNNDDVSNRTVSLKSIRFRADGVYHAMRRFPANHLWFDYKQLEFTNAYTYAQASDDVGDCAVDFNAKTATLNDGYTEVWDTNAIGYYISFSDDEYDTEFEVTARTDTTLTFSDAGGNAPATGTYDWVLRGYLKGEQFYLQKYTVKFAYTGGTSGVYDSAQSGGNA